MVIMYGCCAYSGISLYKLAYFVKFIFMERIKVTMRKSRYANVIQEGTKLLVHNSLFGGIVKARLQTFPSRGPPAADVLHDGVVCDKDLDLMRNYLLRRAPFYHLGRAPGSIPSIQITFNTTGGSYIPPTTRAIGERKGELPVPAKPYHNFTGWFTAPTGGVRIFLSTITRDYDITFYARWERIPVQVGFIALGATPDFTRVIRYAGDVVGEMPTPTMENYNFLGWFTYQEGGTKVTSYCIVPIRSHIPYQTIVGFFAQWERIQQ